MKAVTWFLCLSVLSIAVLSEESCESADDTVSVEVEAETAATNAVEPEPEPVKHPNALEVIFENQSGKKVELYWDDNINGVKQADLTHTAQITINTFIGHRFYFTPEGSEGSKDTVLYSTVMEQAVGLITLYNERIMRERGQEFERTKSQFMRSYFSKTGRRWQNYYPRDPITHFMYNFTHIGQEIKAASNHTKWTLCDRDTIDQVIPSIIEQQTAFEPTKVNKTTPDFFRAETDDFEVIFYTDIHDTDHYYCRDKNSEDLEVTINVLCTGPKVAYFEGFLTDDECEHIKYMGTQIGLKRSTVSEEALTTEDRTSSTVWIERHYSPIIDAIVRRVADIVRIPERKLFLNASSESLQLVHYEPGQLYKSHVDYGTDRPHNRYLTFLMYLNTVGGGGFTSFPKAPKECLDDNGYLGVEPKQGRVAFFYDLLADGNVDDLTQHYAEPPTEGNEKWMTNLWIWDAVFTR
eukprot:465286_1